MALLLADLGGGPRGVAGAPAAPTGAQGGSCAVAAPWLCRTDGGVPEVAAVVEPLRSGLATPWAGRRPAWELLTVAMGWSDSKVRARLALDHWPGTRLEVVARRMAGLPMTKGSLEGMGLPGPKSGTGGGRRRALGTGESCMHA